MAIRLDKGASLNKPTELPNGWLRVDGYLTRPGIFVYRDDKGGERREYRPDSEVFAPASLETYQLSPLTDDHPPTMLDATNARDHMRGSVGVATRADGKVASSMLVMDAELIAKMRKDGKVEVSCGYECDLDETPGEFQGQRYDAIQRNIRINHVAIVDAGRAGPEVRVRIDSALAMVAEIETTKKEPLLMTKKIKFDGVEYEVTEQSAQLLDVVQSRLDAAVKECSALQARLDATSEKLTAAEKARKDAEDPSTLARLVAARTKLENDARKVLGSEAKLDGQSAEDIMRAVVAKANPALDLTGKDGSYLEARFDGYVEDAKPKKGVNPFAKKGEEEDEEDEEEDETVREDSVARTDAASAREKMLAYNRSLSQIKEGK